MLMFIINSEIEELPSWVQYFKHNRKACHRSEAVTTKRNSVQTQRQALHTESEKYTRPKLFSHVQTTR